MVARKLLMVITANLLRSQTVEYSNIQRRLLYLCSVTMERQTPMFSNRLFSRESDSTEMPGLPMHLCYCRTVNSTRISFFLPPLVFALRLCVKQKSSKNEFSAKAQSKVERRKAKLEH